MPSIFIDVTEYEIKDIIDRLNPQGFEIEKDGSCFIAGYCVQGNDFNWLPNSYKTWEEAGKKLIAEIIGKEKKVFSDALRERIEEILGESFYEVDEDDDGDLFASLDGEFLFKNGIRDSVYDEEYEAYLEVYIKLAKRLN